MATKVKIITADKQLFMKIAIWKAWTNNLLPQKTNGAL